MPQLERLKLLLREVPAKVRELPREAGERPAPGVWSAKEEFGHLLDSAANNHQRIVRGQLEDRLQMPSYDGERWVELHRYQQRDWPELIDTWILLNRQLLSAAEAAPEAAWSHTLTVGDSEPMTLEFVFDDYLDHMVHHLHHMGVGVEKQATAG